MVFNAYKKHFIDRKKVYARIKGAGARLDIKTARVFLLFFLVVCASVYKGQERYAIPGTKLSIVPVPGKKELSGNFPMIREVGKYNMLFIELHEKNFREKMKLMDSASYSRRGARILEQQDFFINPYYKARVLISSTDSAYNELVCIFGDDSFFTMVTAQYDPGVKKLKEQIITALQSIRYDQQKQVNWKDYSVVIPDASNAFKLVEKECSSVGLLFSRNAGVVQDASEESSIGLQQFVHNGRFATGEQMIMSQFSGYISSSRVTLDKVLFEGPAIIGEVETYRFVADCTKEGKKVHLNLMAVITDGYDAYIFAVCKKPGDATEIEKFMSGLKFKQNVYYEGR